MFDRLREHFPDKKIHYLTVTGSTNSDAVRRARLGGKEGEIFIADKQTAGRGRLGRPWESPEGKNLYLSFLLKPTVSPSQSVFMTLMAAVATFEAVLSFLPKSLVDSCQIKWPNDLLLHGKKLAGILTEMSGKGEQVHWVVSGIGLNINAEPENFSPEVRKIATSLKLATGREVDRESVAIHLIESFDRHYHQFSQGQTAEFIEFCNQHSYLKGRRVRSEEVFGIAGDLSPEGYLQIRTDSGETKAVIAGDVTVEEGS